MFWIHIIIFQHILILQIDQLIYIGIFIIIIYLWYAISSIQYNLFIVKYLIKNVQNVDNFKTYNDKKY